MLDSYTPELLIIDPSSTFFYFVYLFVPRVLIVYALFIDRFIHGLVDVKKKVTSYENLETRSLTTA